MENWDSSQQTQLLKLQYFSPIIIKYIGSIHTHTQKKKIQQFYSNLTRSSRVLNCTKNMELINSQAQQLYRISLPTRIIYL